MSEQRAALAERMARAIQSAVRKEVTMNVLRQDMLAAEAALAAVEAAGGWPPVVTPDPPVEVRDVLVSGIARGLEDWACASWGEIKQLQSEFIADAGLAALRAKGFAVVRTADVEPRTCLGCKHFRGDESAGWFCFQLDSGKVHPTFACAAWEAIR